MSNNSVKIDLVSDYMFTDTHCHIFKEYYEDIEAIIDVAKKRGVQKMICNGTNYENNREVLELAKSSEGVYAAIGFHPEDIDTFEDNQLNLIIDNIEEIVAIGEIGLDYHYDIDRELQKNLFRKQLALAQKYHKPVIVHSREATEDTIKLLKEFPDVHGVIHCFSGSIETARIYIKMGYKLGFGGVSTFKNSKIYEVISKIPLSSIVLETDSPYLTPEPYRGTKNEPAYIPYIAEKICSIRTMTMEELSIATEENVKAIFDI